MIYALQTFGKHTEIANQNVGTISKMNSQQKKNSAILIMISCLKPWIQLKKINIPL